MFVLAGFETLWHQLQVVEREFGEEILRKALEKGSDRFLVTYAYNAGKLNSTLADKSYEAYNEELLGFLTEVRSKLPQVKIYIDSGGYQISIGAISLDVIPVYLDAYRSFLKEAEKANLIFRSFSLDVIPPDNLVSDKRLRNLIKHWNVVGLYFDEDFLSLLRIYHFNARCVFRYFTKVFDEYFPDFLQSTKQKPPKLSVGGLVAFDRSRGKLITVPYLVIAILLAKKYNLRELEFHVLGVSAWKDILALLVLQRLFEIELGVNFQFTFDSSRLFKFTVRGKAIEVFDKHLHLHQLVYKTSYLKKPFTFNGQTRTYKEWIRVMLEKFVETEFPNFRIFEDESDPTSRPVPGVEVLIMLFQSYVFKTYLKVVSERLKNATTTDEVLTIGSSIALRLVGQKSYRKFLHQLQVLPRLIRSSPSYLEAVLLEIFSGVTRLEYFC